MRDNESDEDGRVTYDRLSPAFCGCTAVWLTKWCHPFGGGESAFYECMKFASELGIRVYWLSFTNAKNEPHPKLRIIPLRHGNPESVQIHVPGGMELPVIEAWLRMLRPTFAHEQGTGKPDFLRACERLNIPIVNAFHFWHDAIIMSPQTLNLDMELHLAEHKPDPNFDALWRKSVVCYVASEYMRDIIEKVTGKRPSAIVHPVSAEEECLVPVAQCKAFDSTTSSDRSSGLRTLSFPGESSTAVTVRRSPPSGIARKLLLPSLKEFLESQRADFGECYADPWHRPCITMINIHKMKGGEILLQMIEAMPAHSFIAVRTEHYSEDLDARIAAAVEKRNKAYLLQQQQLSSTSSSTSSSSSLDARNTAVVKNNVGGNAGNNASAYSQRGNHGTLIAPCFFVDRVADIRRIYALTKLLIVPSLVDETFCRVALESMVNRIPMITTGCGNIRNIVGAKGAGHATPTSSSSSSTSSSLTLSNTGGGGGFESNDLHSASRFTNHRIDQGDEYASSALIKLSRSGIDWARSAEALLSDHVHYRKMQDAGEQRYRNVFSRQLNRSQLYSVLENVEQHLRAKQMVMFYTPWCDQGLGVQSRSYCRLLEQQGVRTCVFAFAPYWQGLHGNNQRDPREWDHPRVTYSPNNRENVTDQELAAFVMQHKVTACVIPETCWYRVFQIARTLGKMGVRTFGIPNIEIVRKDELHKHRYFYKLLCNNAVCENVFRAHGFESQQLVRIGYSIPPGFPSSAGNSGRSARKPFVTFHHANFQDDHAHYHHGQNGKSSSSHSQNGFSHTEVHVRPVRFLFVGGLNAFSRKQVLEVLEAFKQARSTRDAELASRTSNTPFTQSSTNSETDTERHKNENHKNRGNTTPPTSFAASIEITACVQVVDEQRKQMLQPFASVPGVTLVLQHQSYDNIMALYASHDIVIQVSRHEGLGLGFYEALSMGCPVITLDTAPHNELVVDGINGAIVPCTYTPMLDNTDGLVHSAVFKPADLARKMLDLTQDTQLALPSLVASTRDDYASRFNYDTFARRFSDALLI